MNAKDYGDLLRTKSALESALVVVARILKGETSKQDMGEAVIGEICRYSKIPEIKLTDTSRSAGVVFYKRIACYLLSDYCKWPLQKTAGRMGLENHATALFHRDKMRVWMKETKFAPTEVLVATNNIINNLGL